MVGDSRPRGSARCDPFRGGAAFLHGQDLRLSRVQPGVFPSMVEDSVSGTHQQRQGPQVSPLRGAELLPVGEKA